MELEALTEQPLPGRPRAITFSLRNTGTVAAVDRALHPRDVGEYLTSDIYRLSVEVDGAGWSARLPNALVAVEAGEAKQLVVYVSAERGSDPAVSVTLLATSESDPTRAATASAVAGR